ncbi:MAG: MFS transporter [Chitinivibrionia bacterium]|nr:MFS transporter [Chitinivibrionia bacterium]
MNKRFHPNIRILAWVSFLTDASSEIIYPIIPFFLTVTLGAPATALGIMEGFAEALSAAFKGMSGPLSDRMRRRKPLVFAGYALSTLSKALLALSPAWGFAAGSRMLERAGKGVRSPARDALLAECTDKESKGSAFGFHRAMDTWGAVVGTSTALVLLLFIKHDFRWIILVSLVPAFLAVLLTFRIKEAAGAAGADRRSLLSRIMSPPSSPRFRRLVLAYGVFSLGTSSATFLILRAGSIESSYAAALLPYLFANVVYAATAERAGRLSDRAGRKAVILAGMLLFALAYAVMFLFASTAALFAALALYGLHMACTEGVGKAFVTDTVAKEEYGNALGFFYFTTGTATLLASIAAGVLWDNVSPRALFLQGALFGILGALLLASLMKESRDPLRRNA